MTEEQLYAQYAIKPNQYEIFAKMFNEGKSQQEMCKHFNCGFRGLLAYAKRFGFSFLERRTQKKFQRMQDKHNLVCFPKRPHRKPDVVIYSEKYRLQKSEQMTALNKLRATPQSVKNEIISLYFGDDYLSAQQIADQLQITNARVRSTINNYYASLDINEASKLKQEKASKSRSGVKNPAHKAWLARNKSLMSRTSIIQ